MANTFGALKRVRQEKRRTLINRMRKSRLRHAVRSLRRLIEKKDAAGATKELPVAFSMIDRSARWGIIKANTAARYKSRMHARLKSLTAA